MQHNLIFLTEFDLDKPIYRVFRFDMLVQIFIESQLTLVKPRTWEDPFENFILNSTGYLSDGREFQISFRDNFYGQCWTFNKESDAMCRIYSPNKDGVKVKTTMRKLFTPLFDLCGHNYRSNGELYNQRAFIGRVQYAGTKTLLKMLEDEERMNYKVFDQTGRGQASTFFYKRVAFRHEKEIRIIYNALNNSAENPFFKLGVNPNQLIDEIVFDPRMTNEDYIRHKRQVQDLGFQNSIVHSGLYKINNLRISLTPPF